MADDWRLTALLANGQIINRNVSAGLIAEEASPWHGTAAVDGSPGSEIVLVTSQGAHLQSFEMYTYRNGRLADVNTPGADENTWVIDSASLGFAGVTCGRQGTQSTVLLTSYSRVDGASPGYEGDETLYGWNGTGWTKLSETHRVYGLDDPALRTLGGWRCPGLPEF
ncbi:hypothetical protein MXD62_37230 [Frankia sp. Mgl5]|uniref:hypothetical protein n=1 Tax=Frankia sp. Mgl5 TaxID=2933793 RepID=UPI00200E1720|nr:hypothetical protein [Frankia sp. Mgl5]MCK9932719.1 hypothetical protein [Frankia sp. Mgl5]